MQAKRLAERTLLSAALLSFGVAAHAADVASAAPGNGEASNDGLQLEEVVVTSTKTGAQSLQEVPAAISNFSGEQLEKFNVVDTTGLTELVPGVIFQTNATFAGAANFFIRGIGENTSNPSNDPAVGVFIDGMYLGVNLGVVTDLFDVESIDVLRGPQGTLFGRNVTAGAVVIRSKRPTGRFGFAASGVLGNYDQRTANVMVEGPLVEGKLNGKIAVLSSSHDGYFYDAARPDRSIGKHDSQLVRPILEFLPTENLSVTFIGEFGTMKDWGSPTKNIRLNSTASPPGPAGGFNLVNNGDPKSDQQWYSGVLESVWRGEDATWTTTASYRKYDIDSSVDASGTFNNVFSLIAPSGMDQDQHSLESIFNFSPLSWLSLTAGANYFHQDFEYREVRRVLSQVTAGGGTVDENSSGVFAQADLSLTPQWTLTLGGRYSYDHKDVRISNLGACNASWTVCTTTFSDDKSWEGFTPKVAVKWTPTDNLMAYASFASGLRSGGFNIRNSVGSPGPYDPEQVDSYEIGGKAELLERRIRLNAAIYRNNYDDMQLTALNSLGQQKTLNVGTAVIRGFEFEPSVLVTPRLLLSATYSYIDAYYTRFDNAPIANPATAVDFEPPQVPRHQFSVNAEYVVPILENYGEVAVRGSYAYLGERMMDVLNTTSLPSHGLSSGSIDFESQDGSFVVSLFGDNLGNEYHVTTGTSTGLFLSQYVSPPRTYGLRVSYRTR